MNDRQSQKRQSSDAGVPWGLAAIVLSGIVALWVGYAAFVLYFGPSYTETGTFGDAFGALNTLFSGLALSGVVFSVLLQSRELRLQRDELRLQREELKEARKVAQAQADELKAQKDALNKQVHTAASAALVQSSIELCRASMMPDTKIFFAHDQEQGYRPIWECLLSDIVEARENLKNTAHVDTNSGGLCVCSTPTNHGGRIPQIAHESSLQEEPNAS